MARRELSQWAWVVAVGSATTAHAADLVSTSTRGGPVCSILVFGAFYLMGVGFWRSLGLTLVPPAFVWSVHQDEELSRAARAVGWIWSALWSLAFLCAVVGGLLLAFGNSKVRAALEPAQEVATDVSQIPDMTVLSAKVTSTPPGASITVNGQLTGKVTPSTVTMRVGEQTVLGVELSGHFPQTRAIEPNLHDKVDQDFTLERGAQLEATTFPPGAQVQVAGEVVLEKTPGLTKAFTPGHVSVRVVLPGYLPVEEELDVEPQTAARTWKLEPCETIHLEAQPPGDVKLDGRDVGQTPVDLPMVRDSKHVVVVSKPGFATWTKVLPKARSQTLTARLVDVELKAARARVARAQKAYDDMEAKLAPLQNRHRYDESPSLLRAMQKADALMLKATTELEKAQEALTRLEERRASGE